MTTARTLRREQKKREIRTAKASNARDAIGTLERGCEVFILTFGQFSLLDAISTILDQTGPADVAISTWTAAAADLQRSSQILRRGGFKSLRMIVDRSFLTRQPEYCKTMRSLFGDESIRTARLHSKFATVNAPGWSVAIRTSMNLNENPRLENLEISDDRALNAFLLEVVDDLFENQQIGIFDGELPSLSSEDTAPPSIAAGRIDSARLRVVRTSR